MIIVSDILKAKKDLSYILKIFKHLFRKYVVLYQEFSFTSLDPINEVLLIRVISIVYDEGFESTFGLFFDLKYETGTLRKDSTRYPKSMARKSRKDQETQHKRLRERTAIILFLEKITPISVFIHLISLILAFGWHSSKNGCY